MGTGASGSAKEVSAVEAAIMTAVIADFSLRWITPAVCAGLHILRQIAFDVVGLLVNRKATAIWLISRPMARNRKALRSQDV